MNFVIKILRVAAPEIRVPFEGEYLRTYSDSVDGIRRMTTTSDIRQAQSFPSFDAALAFWQQQSQCVPLRPDNKPNRPLTAFTVDIGPIPE
jgi:hypothetical protein